jgi:hypothetical protein
MIEVKAKTLTEWLIATRDSHNQIDAAIAEWVMDHEFPDTEEGIKEAIRRLEMTDCSACAAPHGLIYTSDLMDKLASWKREILDALNEYYDATGTEYTTGEPGNFVWFAVEWRAHELASELRAYFDVEG